jgi:hypothetical protein
MAMAVAMKRAHRAVAMHPRARRAVALATTELLVVALAGVAWLLFGGAATASDTVRLVAAGDMACDPRDPAMRPGARDTGDRCRQADVSTLAAALNPDVVLGLGDYQYETPTADAYRDVYGPSWGRLRAKTVPVLGNEDYKVRDARPTVDYFGKRVRDPRGYWSQEVGGWHLVVLNSNCSSVDGGCDDGSPQQQWLEGDLRRHPGCVLAAWHHPRWSTGIIGPDERTGALYRTLRRHRVELVLSGHEADYERFGPLDDTGKSTVDGVRQFVVGTGGEAHYRPKPADSYWRGRISAPASEFVDFDHHGVLELELRPGQWSWRFHALDAGVPDQGQARCG